MTEVAPDALKWLGSRIAPDLGGVLSGIVGDKAHTRGYHRGRNYVPTTDYSRQLTEDKNGSGENACAIDMSFSTSKMKLYTGRLKAAAERNDPRLRYVREFYGTIDGVNVFGRTHKGSTDATWEWSTSDKSHLWHVHLSILRQYSNIKSVMQGILDVLMGKPLVVATPTTPEVDEMALFTEKHAEQIGYIDGRVLAMATGTDTVRQDLLGGGSAVWIVQAVKAIASAVSSVDEEVAAKLKADFDRINAEVAATQTAVAGVDEAVLEQIKAQPTPEETAALLKAVLGDQADAVFRAGLAAEGFVA